MTALQRGSRSALIYFLAAFVVVQCSLIALVETASPELRDPEFGHKLHALRQKLKAEPARPLLLVLGSSRAGMGISPRDIDLGQVPDADRPLVFNFALRGSGPVIELLCLRRLLREGIRPRWLVVEVLPPLLHEVPKFAEENWFHVSRLGISDWPLMREYAKEPWHYLGRCVAARLAPCFSWRFTLMSRVAPDWIAWDNRQDGWSKLDPHGWLPHRVTEVTLEEYFRGQQFAHEQYAPVLADYDISPRPRRALEELLTLCRRQGIRPMLLLMPEGTAFTSWYSPQARSRLDRCLRELSAEYKAELVDARDWLPDFAFFDGHHLLPRGAQALSQRLAREKLTGFLMAGNLRKD